MYNNKRNRHNSLFICHLWAAMIDKLTLPSTYTPTLVWHAGRVVHTPSSPRWARQVPVSKGGAARNPIVESTDVADLSISFQYSPTPCHDFKRDVGSDHFFSVGISPVDTQRWSDLTHLPWGRGTVHCNSRSSNLHRTPNVSGGVEGEVHKQRLIRSGHPARIVLSETPGSRPLHVHPVSTVLTYW